MNRIKLKRNNDLTIEVLEFIDNKGPDNLQTPPVVLSDFIHTRMLI